MPPRHRPSPCRRFFRHGARPSISRRRSPSPASCPSSAAQHRPGGQIDRRDIHAGGAEQQRRRGLVAAAISTTPSTGVAAQQFLGRPSPADCGRAWWSASGRISDSDSAGNSIGKPPAIRNAALDVIDPRFEMHVAGLRVRPGVEDRDPPDGPSTPPARNPSAWRASDGQGAQIVGRKPARAAELVGLIFLSVMSAPLRRMG